MKFSVQDHTLILDKTATRFVPARSQRDEFAPEGIVLHDTAGRLDKFNTVDYFRDTDKAVSAHFVVERDGTVTQMAKLNRKTHHAGKSNYPRGGRPDVNAFAFGVEIVNLGGLTKQGDTYRPWFSASYKEGGKDGSFTELATPDHEHRHWQHYTEPQILAVTGLCQALFSAYKLNWLTTHWYISPGRKEDTNPLFPLDQVRSLVLGEADEEGNSAIVSASANQRKWPSYADNVIQVIERGAKVSIIRFGDFQSMPDQKEKWYLISHNGHEGWMNASALNIA
jgi:N-acetylmuramoyl-L-alanine amidase